MGRVVGFAMRWVVNPVFRVLLDRGLMSSRFLVLRFSGRRSGTTYEHNLGYVRDGARLLVRPGDENRRWWHNFVEPRACEVLLDGRWQKATGRVLRSADADQRAAVIAFRAGSPRALQRRIGDGDVIVELTVGDDDA